MSGEDVESGLSRAGVAAWRLPLVVALAILGLGDYLAFNLVVWPRCVASEAPTIRASEAAPPSEGGHVVSADPKPVEREREGSGSTGARQPAQGTEAAPMPQVEASQVPQVEASQVPQADATATDESSTMGPPAIEDLLFETKSAALSKRAMQGLDNVAEYMVTDRKQRVLIRGHADERGNELANKALSERRATAAAAYLRLGGISLNRIEYEGVGEREPADRRGTPAARARNRRIEIIWLQGGAP